MRPDIYMEAMKELGATPTIAPMQKFALFDGVAFDMANPEQYARSFPINSLAG
jgi:hypothetical protein